MAISQELATLFVTFSTKGFEAVKDQAAGLKAGFDQFGKGAIDQVRALAAALSPVAQLFQRLSLREATGQALGGMSQALTGLAQALRAPVLGLYGFVAAGVAASGMGQIIGYQMEELSRQIASLFVPQISLVIEKLGALVRWFQNLSGQQQAAIRQWALAAGAVVALAAVLPRVIASIQALQVAMGGLRVALLALSANPFVLLLAGVAALLLLMVDFKALAQDLGGAFQDAGRTGKGALDDLRGALGDARGLVKDLLGKVDELSKKWTGIDWKTRERGLGLIALAMGAYDTATEAERRRRAGQPLTGAQAFHLAGFGAASERFGPAGFGAIASRLIPGLESYTGLGLIRRRIAREDEEAKAKDQLMPRLGGFESLENTYRRIAQASIKATAGVKPTEELTLEEIQAMGRTLTQLWDYIQTNVRPPVRQ